MDFGSYSQGVATTVANTPRAIGYVETALARVNGLSLAGDLDNLANRGQTTVAVGPTYVVFRGTYATQEQADAATTACLSFTDTNKLAAASFDPSEFGADAAPGGNPGCNAIAGPQ